MQALSAAHTYCEPTMPPEPNKITILFLAANPVDQRQLAIDEEMRAIDAALVGAKFREMFDLRSAWAVRYGDLQELLLRYEPHIVHFSAHGSETGELLLKGADGKSYPVPPAKLAELFDLLKDNVRCVVLNACFSEEQAHGIAASIDCVVGMTRAVQDGDAIEFAIGFYLGIGYGRSVKTAFGLGRNRISSPDGQEVASLAARSGVDPAQLIIISGNRQMGNSGAAAPPPPTGDADYPRLVVPKLTTITGPQHGQLAEALASTFDQQSLTQMVQVKLTQTLPNIVGGGTFGAVTFNLVDWAKRSGYLTELVQGALDTQPRNQKLRDFARSVGAREA